MIIEMKFDDGPCELFVYLDGPGHLIMRNGVNGESEISLSYRQALALSDFINENRAALEGARSHARGE